MKDLNNQFLSNKMRPKNKLKLKNHKILKATKNKLTFILK